MYNFIRISAVAFVTNSDLVSIQSTKAAAASCTGLFSARGKHIQLREWGFAIVPLIAMPTNRRERNF